MSYARHTDPGTSHEAAGSLNITQLESIVHDALTNDPMTSNEIADKTGLALNTVSPRLKRMEEKGMVIRSGFQKQPSGRSRTIWTKVELDT